MAFSYIIECNIAIAGPVNSSKKHYFEARELLQKYKYPDGSIINKLITWILMTKPAK